ncbi:MAG: amidohydrolase [Planctomycetes bacterium]|nr:amidohydrolase [Planctomycetota bacterium]
MTKKLFARTIVALCFTPVIAVAVDAANKNAAIGSVDKHRQELIRLSDQIWRFAETALRETKSARVLADYAQSQGFTVERGVSKMPTAFVATYGSGRPIIGIMGEFDALPGLSQKPVPQKEVLTPGAAGHGCGHNMFGAASLGAAIAVKELIQAGKLKGTIRFYGTPAEESVGGKIYMARDGLFRDVDICLAWHPSDKTRADTKSSMALIDFVIEFHGQAAHAAADPWNGRSALDALELFTHGLNMLREHVKPTVRMHYAIVATTPVPNIVPEYTKLWVWVRDWTREGVDDVFQRVKKIADGAAMMAGVDHELSVLGGDYELLVNMTGAKLLHKNLLRLGPIEYTEEEQAFARAIQRATGKPEKGVDGEIKPGEGQKQEGGSTDVGDISWNVPTLHLSVTTAPVDTPWHSWPVVACGGMSIGHKGMIYAAKALAATMVDLFEDESTRKMIQAEFKEKVAGHVWDPYIPDGPPPVPTD